MSQFNAFRSFFRSRDVSILSRQGDRLRRSTLDERALQAEYGKAIEKSLNYLSASPLYSRQSRGGRGVRLLCLPPLAFSPLFVSYRAGLRRAATRAGLAPLPRPRLLAVACVAGLIGMLAAHGLILRALRSDFARRHNAAACFRPAPFAAVACGLPRRLARGGFAPAAQKQTPLSMPLPFAVVTARGPAGLPRLPRLRLCAPKKKTQEQDKRLRRSCVFFSACAAARPRLRARARLRRRTCRRLAAAFRLRPWRPRPSPRGGVFPPLRSGGLCAAPYGRRFFTPFAPPNKIKTFGLCVFLYACGAAFAFLISTLRRNLFVSPPSAPLSPRGERGKPIAIFLLDIS